MRLPPLLAGLIFIATPTAAPAHDHYTDWVNGLDEGCCNERDCGAIQDSDERTIAGKLEVRVKGRWCQVLWWHYLKEGNAANWEKSHVCVIRTLEWDERSPCDRFRCYQPKPGSSLPIPNATA